MRNSNFCNFTKKMLNEKSIFDCSFVLIKNYFPAENPCKDKINEHLPDDIKVFAIKRVTKGFNSKSQCDARTYSYTIPTYAFAPENLELYPKKDEYHDIEKRKEQLSIIDGKPFSEYRISKEDVQRLSEVLKLFQGTHNFHNFTAKV